MSKIFGIVHNGTVQICKGFIIWSLKNNYFVAKKFCYGFNNNWCKFCSFCVNGDEWNEAKRKLFFGSKRPNFQSQSYYLVRYLSHLGFQVGSSNWVHKTRIHSIQRWCNFGAKTSSSAFLLEKRLHHFLYWIRYPWSRSTHIPHYINLPVRWNILLRNQISSCQQVFYYTTNHPFWTKM